VEEGCTGSEAPQYAVLLQEKKEQNKMRTKKKNLFLLSYVHMCTDHIRTGEGDGRGGGSGALRGTASCSGD